MNYVLNTIHGWGISAREHMHTALLYLRNGLTDCVQIWYMGWRSLSKCFPQVMDGMEHLCTCARAPQSPYLRIRVANYAKIVCVSRDPIVTGFTRVGGGVTTFARACPVSLSRKPLSPGIKAAPKNGLISFALACSSPNMASYWSNKTKLRLPHSHAEKKNALAAPAIELYLYFNFGLQAICVSSGSASLIITYALPNAFAVMVNGQIFYKTLHSAL